MLTWTYTQCNPSKMVKDETCYNLNGFIKKIKFLTKKVINIYIYFGKIKNN